MKTKFDLRAEYLEEIGEKQDGSHDMVNLEYLCWLEEKLLATQSNEPKGGEELSIRKIRTRVITGSFAIGNDGLKEPYGTDGFEWERYAKNLEEMVSKGYFNSTHKPTEPAGGKIETAFEAFIRSQHLSRDWEQFYEEWTTGKPTEQPCQYESDNTTAMNCKWCGKAQWEHNQPTEQLEIGAITFKEFIAYGLKHSKNIVDGMPWSFEYKGHPVTHENDECYLVETPVGMMEFTPKDMLFTDLNGDIFPQKIPWPLGKHTHIPIAGGKGHVTWHGDDPPTEKQMEAFEKMAELVQDMPTEQPEGETVLIPLCNDTGEGTIIRSKPDKVTDEEIKAAFFDNGLSIPYHDERSYTLNEFIKTVHELINKDK